ncbi:ribonuclease H-like domain-containing protein, partial [Mycena albidolilacea]
AEKAQHAFSADMHSTLHLALPALETLHSTWSGRAKNLKYSCFWGALEEAVAKVDKYYQKTSTSDAYTFAMVLDPRKKLTYLKKHWSADLVDQVSANMEETFKKRYLELHANLATQKSPTVGPKSRATANSGLRELTPDDDDDKPNLSETHIDPTKPWRDEFQGYLNCIEARNAHRYPVWALLARDYLAIMASSVSSERAFSSAGITISKCRNRLKGEIVEAL